MEIQIEEIDLSYRDYYYVDDPKAIGAPEHLHRYPVVRNGWIGEPDAKIIGYAISKFDMPSYRGRLYPLHAYIRLAERLGIPIDEDALEQQWTRKHRRVHRLRRREEIDVTGKQYFNYYRDLVTWYRKQPMPPSKTQKLKSLIKRFGGKKDTNCGYLYAEEKFKAKRKELQTAWDAFVKSYETYKAKYVQWFAQKPKRSGFTSELSSEFLYVLEKGMIIPKESIERIEQFQPMKSTIRLYHPLTEELIVLLDM
jgi:hypothetical protein